MLVLTRDKKVLLQLSSYLAVIDHVVIVIVIVLIVVLVLIVGMQTHLPDLLF